ncbi:hypothetical protein [Aquiflexum gelatinilyticum]|uniref:hypothetical protein n=1 Tax=Aquiflexum gelatinilyticum TaxID=2961943 RepID=UPI00216776AB|nr:hypothetical protein [Aquiflexum gelatinilyticum]MCS4432839.1 hypothetical protein [Aquiflexum gelatinilyticum]
MDNNSKFQLEVRQERFEYAKSKAESLMDAGFKYLIYEPRPNLYPNHHYFKSSRVFDRNLNRRQIAIDSPRGHEILAWYAADGDGHNGSFDILQAMRMEEHEMHKQMEAENEKLRAISN